MQQKRTVRYDRLIDTAVFRVLILRSGSSLRIHGPGMGVERACPWRRTATRADSTTKCTRSHNDTPPVGGRLCWRRRFRLTSPVGIGFEDDSTPFAPLGHVGSAEGDDATETRHARERGDESIGAKSWRQTGYPFQPHF